MFHQQYYCHDEILEVSLPYQFIMTSAEVTLKSIEVRKSHPNNSQNPSVLIVNLTRQYIRIYIYKLPISYVYIFIYVYIFFYCTYLLLWHTFSQKKRVERRILGEVFCSGHRRHLNDVKNISVPIDLRPGVRKAQAEKLFEGAIQYLGGETWTIFYFHPEPWGFMIQFDDHILQWVGSTTT